MGKEYSNENGLANAGVSRRRFVQAASAAGITTSLAGCTGGNGGSDAVVVSADSVMADASDEIISALRNSLLPERVERVLPERHKIVTFCII